MVRDLKNSFPLSEKYLDFINTIDNVDADFLEGTTASGITDMEIKTIRSRISSMKGKLYLCWVTITVINGRWHSVPSSDVFT